MGSLTNVWIPEHQKDALRKACEYYRFNTMAAYFRACATALIEHHERKDSIPAPFKFQTTSTKK